MRDIVYFGGHDILHPLLVLLLWPVASLAILMIADLIHLSVKRRSADPAHEIYRTAAVVHRHCRHGKQPATV